MHERVRFKTYDDYANYCTRLEQQPGSIKDITKLMKLGLKEGRTPPRVTLKGVPGQFERLLDGGLRALAKPFENMPESISADQQKELSVRFELKSYPAVYAALKKFGEFVTDDYIPKCRQDIAAISWPDGEEYYAHPWNARGRSSRAKTWCGAGWSRKKPAVIPTATRFWYA